MTQKIVTRNFLLMCSAQFVFSAVFFALMPTLPIYLSRLGTKEAEIGVLIGVLTVSSLIIRPFVGRALLKIPERRFMIAGNLIIVFCSIFYLFAKPFLPLFVLRAIHGVGFGLFSTAAFTLIINITPEVHRGQSVSYFYVAINVATAIAPAFGIFLINRFNFTVLFLVCAGLSLCSLLATLRLEKGRHALPETPIIRHQPILNREALPPAIMGLMSNTIWGALNAFFPLFALTHGVGNPGIFFTVFAAVLLLGRGFGGKILDNYSKEKVIVPCLVVQLIAMLTLSFSTTLPMFLLVAVMWGAGNALLYPILMISAIERAGSSRGPALGTYTALVDLGTGMGSVIMGIIVQWTNYRTMFLCLACMSFMNLFYFNFFVKKKGVERYAHL